jgi:hypothetical protein
MIYSKFFFVVTLFDKSGTIGKNLANFFLPPIYFFPYAYGNTAYIFIIALYSYFLLVCSIERLISLGADY